MLEVLVASSTVMILATLTRACRRRGVAEGVLSHFSYFTLIWYVAFPLRALALRYELMELQAERRFSDEALTEGLALSIVFWVAVFVGERSAASSDRASHTDEPRSEIRGLATLAITVVLALVFLKYSVFAEGAYRGFERYELNNARIGAGAFFLLAELFTFAAVAYLGAFSLVRGRYTGRRIQAAETLLLVVVISLAAFMTVVLHSRRLLAGVVLSLIVVYAVRRQAKWIAVAAVLATFLLSPVLQAFRYVDLRATLDTGRLSSLETTEVLVSPKYWITNVGSSFEGADHVATFVAKGQSKGIWLGIDRGIAWTFNVVLGLVPRAIWPDKPLLFGSVAEQYYLYPEMFPAGRLTATLPPTFVVDFLFGFGVFVGLTMAFVLGRVLGIWGRALWNPGADAASRAVAIFTFVNTFNIVRSGTGFAQPLVIFCVVLGCILGFRETARVLGSIAARVFGGLR